LSVKQQQRRGVRPLAQRLRAGRPPRAPSPGAQASGWDVGGLEQQQALLLAALSRAQAQIVSYDELRDAGIEYPASVVAELELRGFPLERSFGGAAGRKLGVRLDQRAGQAVARPAAEAEDTALLSRRRVVGVGAAAGVATAASGLVRRASVAVASKAARTGATVRGAARLPRGLRGNRRWLVPAMLVLVVGIAAALIAARTSTTGHVTTEYRVGALPGRGSPPARGPAGAPAQRTKSAPQATTPAPASPALAAELEARGHGLLVAGELRTAIPTLRQALAATGKNLAACRRPVSEGCLTYAYALYDLGRALRLARDPAAAVPILEQRLMIANQRATVLRELRLARQGGGT